MTGPRMRVIRDERGVTYVAPGVHLPEGTDAIGRFELQGMYARRASNAAARALLAAQLRALDASMTALKKAQQPYSDGVALARRYGYLN